MPFYTDPQGRVRPIRGRKGGATAIAAVLAGAVVAGGGLGGGAAVESGAGIRPRTAHSKEAARRGRHDEAWRRMGLRQVRRSVRSASECVAHSYGQVRRFFLRTPCRSLQRALLALDEGDGGRVAVSVAWVRMRDARGAARFRRLEDVHGTGDISPLGGELLGLGGIRFTARHYASRRAGPLVVVAEAEPAAGRPDARLLDAVAEVAAAFPPP